MTAAETVVVPLDEVRKVAHAALVGAGCDRENAEAVANVVTLAERDGCASHGIFRLPGYLASLRSGKVTGSARPSVARLAPGVVRIDGQRGFAPLAMAAAREALAATARAQGIAAAAVVNVYHFSALWADIEPLVEDGLVALCFTAYLPAVAPAGGSQPFFGTNPMAFGWPRPQRGAMIFDQASAAMARGEITIAARDGHDVPVGVGIDADGRPTTDPAAILKGAQLPFGGYKGSSIALMVELLCAGLLGQPFSVEAAAEDNHDGGPPRGGVLMLAMDPSRFGDESGWIEHAEAFLRRLRDLPGVRLPGERRARNRERIAREGVRVPAALWDAIVRAVPS